jgi:hypothetical protein
MAMAAFRPPRWSVPVGAGVPAEEILKRQRGGRPKTWGEFWLFNSFWIWALMGWYLAWAFGGGWTGKLMSPLWNLLPADLRIFLMPFPLTWAAWLVKALIYPLAWFGFTLPFLAIVVPLYVLARILGVWESSIHLRTGDVDYGAHLWDLPVYWRLRRAYAVLFGFLLLGFVWKPYVASGLTAALLSVPTTRNPDGLPGLFWLVGVLAALVVWARAREAIGYRRAGTTDERVIQPDAEPLGPAALLRWEARYVLSPVAVIYGLYAAACLLAGRWPFPPEVLGLLPGVLTFTVLGALLARALPQTPHFYWMALALPLAFWFLPIGMAGGVLAGLSPLAGLFSMSGQMARIVADAPLPYPPAVVLAWPAHAAVLFLAAGAATLWDARNAERGTAAEALRLPGALTAMPSTVSGDRAAAAAVAPTNSKQRRTAAKKAAREAPAQAPTQAPASAGKPLSAAKFSRKPDTPVALRFIAWVQGWGDNALAVKEMRVLLRGRLSRGELAVMAGLLLLVPAAAAYRQDISAEFLAGAGTLLFGREVTGLPAIFGGLITVSSFLLALGGVIAGATVCGATLAREREKSTLGFVLLTPLGTREILWGKLLGTLAPTALSFAVVFLWMGLLAVLVATIARPVDLLLGMGFAVTMPLLLTVQAASSGLAFSTLFRRESDAGACAFMVPLFTSIGISVLMGFTYATSWVPGLVTGMPALLFWYLLTAAVTIIITPLALLFTRWRLERARHGDVAFESASAS